MTMFKEFTVSAQSASIAYSPAIVPCQYSTPFNIGFGVEVLTTAVYTVEHTFANPMQVDVNTSAANVVWFSHEFVVSASTNQDGNYAFPVGAYRVRVQPASEGAVRFRAYQAGP